MTVWLACQMGFAGVTDRGALRAGAARVDITPPANPEYRASGKYAHERLYIRAIVLDNGVTRAALIGADQSRLADDVWANASRQIAEELSCPVANIIISATHSHSAVPAGPPAPGVARPPQPQTATIVASIITLVQDRFGCEIAKRKALL
jgi:hypothetical protein